MKKFLSRLLLAVMLIVPVASPVFLSTGCTVSQQQNAVAVEYKTLSSVINVVDVARGVYDSLYKVGRRGVSGEAVIVSDSLDSKIAAIYAEYQRVGNLAIQVAKSQAAVVAAGGTITDATNVYLPQLQTLINQLLALFNSVPSAPQTAPVSIAPNAGV